VPPTGGPYTIADLEGVGPVTGSLTVTGPFIAMSTVTMTSLINAAARPYVATDSVGLLSTGNLALIAISGSASDLASGTVAAARGGAGTLSGLLKANGAGVVSAAVAGTDYSVATNGTLGQALTSNGTGGFSTALTLATVATSGSASDLTAGTLAAAQMPALTGDVTTTVGTVATTVSKINGTTLSGLATGLLKNTTTTGVPSIAVAGTDLIGGVGNLTTVGSVPYVSASGILNQDAGQFFWDATNNRLGIGTNAPVSRLQIGNYTVGTDEKITVAAGNGYTSALSLYDFSTAYGFTIQNNGASGYLDFLRHNNSVPGVSAMVISRANGNVGIGTTTPATSLQVVGGKILLDNAQGIQFKDSTGTARTILQVDSGDNVYLDSAATGGDTFFRASGVDRMTIKGTSGNVGIGMIGPGYKLEVRGSSNTEIARVGDGTRSFGISTYTPNSGGVTLRNSGTGLISLTAVNAVLIGTSYAGLGTGVPANTVAIEGNVGIGTTTPVYLLDVAKSGASGTARFYDQTATTGATRVAISLGAADTSSTQVFEIGGLMKFSGSNSTGAGIVGSVRCV
jgi:hypothetical protein